MNLRKSRVFATYFGIVTLATLAVPSLVRAEPNVRLKGDYYFGGIESPEVRTKAKTFKPAVPEIFISEIFISGRASSNSDSVILNTPIGPVRLDVQKGKPQKPPFPPAELYNVTYQSETETFQLTTQ